jgi:hypothetical protein
MRGVVRILEGTKKDRYVRALEQRGANDLPRLSRRCGAS